MVSAAFIARVAQANSHTVLIEHLMTFLASPLDTYSHRAGNYSGSSNPKFDSRRALSVTRERSKSGFFIAYQHPCHCIDDDRSWYLNPMLSRDGQIFYGPSRDFGGPQIITSGPYSYVRHPGYTGVYLDFSGMVI